MKTKSKTVTLVIILLLAASAAAWYFYYAPDRAKSSLNQYNTVEVSRGAIERVIASTGTLSPVGSVEVGTQVSGTLEKVLVDFNDTVRAGQIIAEIDRGVLLTRLSEVQASLARADALFMQSEQEFKRGEVLFEKGLISEQEFVKYRTDYHSQKASLQVAKAAVATAEENVRYATIRSPVRGTVITRNVDVGQTVAASLSAPTLFVIAEDLRKMQIMALVDETDIGKINTNQEVRFSVQAYPDRNYTGAVSQIRLQPEIVQNVVTYTVVVLADNNDGTLLPGMTANVEFVEARDDDALLIPAAAFRFRPPDDVVKRFEDERREAREAGKMMKRDGGELGDNAERDSRELGDNTKRDSRELGSNTKRDSRESGNNTKRDSRELGDNTKRDGRELGNNTKRDGRESGNNTKRDGRELGDNTKRDGRELGDNTKRDSRELGNNTKRDSRESDSNTKQGGGGKEKKRKNNWESSGRGTLWTLDGNNELKPVYVRMGINDGAFIAVSGGDDVYEGLAVVTGVAGGGKEKQAKTGTRSLLPQQQGGPGFGGGPRRM